MPMILPSPIEVAPGAGIICAAVAIGIAAGSAADLTLGHLATDVVFRAVGMKRDRPQIKGFMPRARAKSWSASSKGARSAPSI